MSSDISGDARLSLGNRLLYLVRNLRRNLSEFAPLYATRPCPGIPGLARGMSPARLYSDHFVDKVLPTLEVRRTIDVLEIGCGSGSLCQRLAGLGFVGRYTGLDIADRFDRTPVFGFEKNFAMSDAAAWAPQTQFDLIVSISALEHIADDHLVIDRARSWLRPGGLQVHIVPGGWALPLYLWHGYRQYSRGAIAKRFNANATIYRLGGIMSFSIHFIVITVGEMLLRQQLRRRWPRTYDRLLSWSRVDARLGCVPANLYAIVERGP